MAGPPGLAYKGVFQFGLEGTWGTAATVDKRLRHVAIRPGGSSDVIESDVMDGTALPLAMYLGKKNATFGLDLELTYSGLLLLLDGLMGTATFGVKGGTDSAGPPYTHVYVFKDLLNSFTCQLGVGNIPAGQCERVTGAKIVGCTISGRAHERLRMSLDFVGKNYETDIAITGSLTAVNSDCILMDSLASFNDGIGATGTILGFDLSFRGNATPRDYSSAMIEEPLRGGFRDVTLTIREEFQNNSALEAQLALTSGAPTLTFGASPLAFTIAMGAGYQVQPVARDPEGKGRIIQSLVWKPVSSGSTDVTLTMINGQALTTT